MNKQLKTIVKISIIIFLAIIQITLMPYFAVMGLWPNLILLLSLVLVLTSAEQEAFLAASLGGLILDLASPLFFGFNTMVLLGMVLATKLIVDKFLSEMTFVIIACFLGLTILVHNLFLSLILHQFSFFPLITNVFYSLFVGLIMFRVLNTWLHGR